MSAPALLSASFAATSVLAFVAYLRGRSQSQIDPVVARLSQYGVGPAEVAPAMVRTGNPLRDLLSSLSNSLNPLLARTSHSGKLAEDLAKADIKMKASEWVLAVVASGLFAGALLALRFGSVLPILVGPVAAWLASGVYLRFRQSRRTRAFERQLGDSIILLSNALKAGYSFSQALATVSKSASPPIGDEFARATREIALGISVDDALNHMVQRNKSEDFDFLVTAVQIQRVVGGNLAEILDTIAFTIRERVRIKGEIRTLTAQARASGWIITVLPIALAGLLSVISPSYFGPMLKETAGRIMLGMGVFSIVCGYAIIQKIVRIEV